MNYPALAKTYNPLLYRRTLIQMLNAFFNTDKYNDFEKHSLHKEINDLIIKNHRGEELYKYLLVKEFYNKNVIAAFEVKVNRSRADFLTVNGATKSFEIKSQRDKLVRLKKQMIDYSAVFEYNYIVTDVLHLDLILNDLDQNYGVWVFDGTKKIEVQKASKILELNSELQLNLCTKKELIYTFDTDNKEVILSRISSSCINTQFKEILKLRYTKRWKFIKDYKDSILPIDVQFFFNSNIDPEIIYRA